MSAFDELMQKYVNNDYNTLVELAKGSVVKLLPVCAKIDEEHKGFFMLTVLILAAIGADGKLSAKEGQFLKDILGLDDEQVGKYVDFYSGKEEDLADKFADALDQDTKFEVVNLVSCIAACDETIKPEEAKFIYKLIQQ